MAGSPLMCSVDWWLRLQAESRKPSLTSSRLHHVGVSAAIHSTDQSQLMPKYRDCEESGRGLGAQLSTVTWDKKVAEPAQTGILKQE